MNGDELFFNKSVPDTLIVIIKNYDDVVFEIELPESEANKLIEQLKEVSEKWK